MNKELLLRTKKYHSKIPEREFGVAGIHCLEIAASL
jgi:hypothetical protein